MKQILLTVGLAATCLAGTWSGKISDSDCGMSHSKMMAGHKDAKTELDCTLACVKGGGKFVFVTTDGKVYQLDNQSNPEFTKHAGHSVKITGEMTGDAIAVSKIDMKK